MTSQDRAGASGNSAPVALDPLAAPRRGAALQGDVHVGVDLFGDQIVRDGRRVRVLGTVHGDLVIDAGARVDLFGTVNGDVHAEGRVNVYDGATIAGDLRGEGIRDRRTYRPPVRHSRWL